VVILWRLYISSDRRCEKTISTRPCWTASWRSRNRIRGRATGLAGKSKQGDGAIKQREGIARDLRNTKGPCPSLRYAQGAQIRKKTGHRAECDHGGKMTTPNGESAIRTTRRGTSCTLAMRRGGDRKDRPMSTSAKHAFRSLSTGISRRGGEGDFETFFRKGKWTVKA